MGAKVQVSLEEYLGHTYEPDCDYVDGELIERNVGENWHSKTQGNFVALLWLAAREPGMAVRPELRMRLGAALFRIPDIALFREPPAESVPAEPPLLVVEVISPDDRQSAILAKLEEFRAFGVPHIWLADPQLKSLYTYGADGLHQVTELRLAELELVIRPTDVF